MTKTIGLALFRRCVSLAALLLAAFAYAPSARCQGDTEFGVWGGYSLGTPHLIGVTSNRQLGELALRYGHSIYDWSNVSLEYTLDVIPVEIVRQPKYAARWRHCNAIAKRPGAGCGRRQSWQCGAI